ncbi:hypothetical protein BGZ96_001906 [Linnemannia gamsii]|uniref:Uncharacterized protein n=1 Tax=Linnemannia gamsii TaxID=64522 RepID=A0ABQ7JLH5_9FUNG|nr:hypothetical protein BGZ96_001906 [Linnemannia gamsii]
MFDHFTTLARCLSPVPAHVPDGVWFFPDKQYAGSLVIKFYSDSVLQLMHKENDISSDVRACFLKANVEANLSLADIRHEYEDTCTPSNIKGILRIHLAFQHVQNGTPATYVKKDPTSGVEDAMVYIDLSNMDSFFDEGVKAHRDDMINLKRLIIWTSSIGHDADSQEPMSILL